MATQKAIALVRNLKDVLAIRLAGTNVVVSESLDSNGDPYVQFQISTGNNSIKAFVRIKAVSTIQVDAVVPSMSARVFTPHVAQVVFDDTTYGTTTTDAQKAAILFEVMRLGTKVEWYSKAVGAAVLALTDIAAANLKLAIEDLQWRDISAI